MIKRLKWILLALLLAVFAVLIAGSHFFTDLMWFNALGYPNLFTTRFAWEWGLRIGAWLGLSLFLLINLFVMRPVIRHALMRFPRWVPNFKISTLFWELFSSA